MTKDEYTKRLWEIVKGVIIEAYLGGGSTRTSEFAIPAIRAIQQLNNEAIGQTGILVKPEPIQGIHQLWLEGRATGYYAGQSAIRQELKAVIGVSNE